MNDSILASLCVNLIEQIRGLNDMNVSPALYYSSSGDHHSWSVEAVVESLDGLLWQCAPVTLYNTFAYIHVI